MRCCLKFHVKFRLNFRSVSAPAGIIKSRRKELSKTERQLQEPRYRHELKYSIGYGDFLALRGRLKAVMQRDPHTGADGRYSIHSIYFDNYHDKALREKEDGVPQREKFRIRYYNSDLEHLTLEKKIKHNSLCMKCSEPLSPAVCRRLLDGPAPDNPADGLLPADGPLLAELLVKMNTQLLRPRVLVSYLREPYIYPLGNVRVTFDMNVRSTMYHRGFLEENAADIRADDPGSMIMEVKYDDFLPSVISDIIQSDGIRQQAFSKYGACRRYG